MYKSLISRSLLLVVTATTFTTITASQSHAQWNPVIWDSGKRVTGVTYDPFSGRIRVKTDHRKVRESVLDPNRSYMDPGSYERVNEYQTDAAGNRWHVTGERWTSNGVPHGNLNRRRVSNIGGGVDHEENENVVYSATGSQRNSKSPAKKSSKRFTSKPNIKTWSKQTFQVKPRNTTRSTPERTRQVQRYNPF
jgi:hypothetical protein